MDDRGRVRLAAVERRCERMESVLRNPLVLAGVLVETLREHSTNNPQMFHPCQVARVLLDMIQSATN